MPSATLAVERCLDGFRGDYCVIDSRRFPYESGLLMRLLRRHRRCIAWVAIVAVLIASSMRALLVMGPLDVGGIPFGHDFCFTGPALDSDIPWEGDAPDKPNHCPFCRLDADVWDVPAIAFRLPPDVPAAISPTAVCKYERFRSIAKTPRQPRAPPLLS